MVLLRDRYKRGIATQREDIQTHNMEVTKRRFAESETSIESMQEDGRLRDGVDSERERVVRCY